MNWWPFSKRDRRVGEPPDYFQEGLRLAGEGKSHEALTSFRLALRRQPERVEVMEQMAVVYTRIGMPDEAADYYERALSTGQSSPAAHYGLAFLSLRRGDVASGREHLEAFLRYPPNDEGAAAHIDHAQRTLSRLESGQPWSGELGDEVGG